MPSSPPPSSSSSPDRDASGSVTPRPKRPRYLVVALVLALVFGAGCWTEGCARLAFYRGAADNAHVLNASIKDEEARARADALYRRFTEVADAARARAVPMAAAMWVLGFALLALASRGLAGKANTRSALVQVVVAQALLVVLSHFVTRDVRDAELDWDVERRLSHDKETLPKERYDQIVPLTHAMRRVVDPSWLVVRTIASALIVVALTRPRSRAFFDAAGTPAADG